MGRGLWWVGLRMGESWWAGSAVHFVYWVDLQTGRGLWWVRLVSGCGPWWVWFLWAWLAVQLGLRGWGLQGWDRFPLAPCGAPAA